MEEILSKLQLICDRLAVIEHALGLMELKVGKEKLTNEEREEIKQKWAEIRAKDGSFISKLLYKIKK